MRKILGFGSDIFWGIVWVFFVLAVGLFLLHLLENHVGGIVGNVASGVESAINPQA